MHCGHRSGLTAPEWQSNDDDGPAQRKYAEIQRKTWEWYSKTVAGLAPIDRLIVNGDALDGKGERSGGTELLTSDMRMQTKMAQRVVEEARARRVAIIKGTSYHVSPDGEDWEEVLADYVGADRCGFHEWFDAGGVILDCKHTVGGSQIPHGRFTALARAQLWSRLWNEKGLFPKSDILVRSHVHYHVYCGGPGWLAMTTPALQSHTKFGSRMIDGTNDLGLISIDVGKEGWSWRSHLLDLKFAAVSPVKA